EGKEASRLMDKLHQKLDARRSAANAALCEEIMSGTGADRLFENQGIDAAGTHWQVVTIRFVTNQAFQDIKAGFGGFPHLIVWLGNTKLTVIVHGDESLPAQIEALCERLSHAYPRLLIGISRPTRHPEHLASRISQAQGCAYHDFIDPNRRMVAYRTGECLPLSQWTTQTREAIAQRNGARFQARLAELTPLLLAERVQMASLVRVWNDLMEAFEAHARTPEVLNEIKRVSEAEELHAFLSDLSSLVAYLRALMEQYLSEDAPRPVAVNESFLEMLDYVREHCCQRLRLADLADQFHLNMAYTSELFHKVVGMTFTDYLTRLRMERAQAMIASGDNTLTEIALSVGYGDYFTFSKRFKQYYGLSPSQAAQKK
ncbi:MAG TPA: helix-turn-helix domain-containing protein, partial [Clostridia bacterium]|nr:helix-turn-helix domain-containing protein [Clostridia bacterium]